MLRLIKKLCQYQKINNSVRLYCQPTIKQVEINTPISPNPNVPGLSQKCISVPQQPVGPNAAKDKEYKNPEYFCYHVDSFFEAEVELAKYRLPAPSNKK